MRPSNALSLHRACIREIALAHRVTNVRVFGSVARGDDIGAIRYELKLLLGVPVDVLTPDALPDRARAHVLRTAQPV